MLGLLGFLLMVGPWVLRIAGKRVSDKVLLSIKVAVTSSLLGLLLLSANGAFYQAESGIGYLVQYPWGTQVVNLDPGFHPVFWGKKFPFKKVLTVKYSKNRDAKYSALYDPIDARFNDTVSADVSLSVRFMMPTDEMAFKKVAVEYRSQENLIGATLSPFVREVVRNSARRLSAQDYVGGRGGEFEADVLDQLRNGLYALKVSDVTGNGEAKDIVTDEDRTMEEGKVVRQIVSLVYDADGEIKRKENSLLKYRIVCNQATIEDVDPEKEFKNRLIKIKAASARAQEQKQLAIAAEQEKRRVIAEGETTKAQKRVEEEEKQIVKLTQAETSKKEAKIDKEAEEFALQKARLTAEKTKTLADAEAYQKRKVMEADGALEKKLATLEKIAEVAADGWSKRQVPSTVIGASGNGGGGAEEFSVFMNMMLADFAKKLEIDPNIKGTSKR